MDAIARAWRPSIWHPGRRSFEGNGFVVSRRGQELKPSRQSYNSVIYVYSNGGDRQKGVGTVFNSWKAWPNQVVRH